MRRGALALICVAAVLAGCAASKLEMRYEGTAAEADRLWPAPQTQEVPRYRYLGQLTGEGNFKSANGEGGWQRFWAAVTGLDERRRDARVLQRPQSGTVDAQGRVLVTDVSRNAVFVFDEARGRLDLWDMATRTERFKAPIGVVAGRGGELLVADAELGRVFRLDAEGKPVGEFGAGVLKRPTGLARDAARGRVYVADTHAHDVKVFDDDGRLVDTVGARGEGEGRLNFPTHLALAQGTLWVSDSLNARVQAFDEQGAPGVSVGRRGLYVGNLVRPKGVAADDEGHVYVVESMHDTLLVFDRAGRLLLSIGGTGSEVGKFYLPAGVWLDGRDRVYVADMYNGRVVVFQFLGGG